MRVIVCGSRDTTLDRKRDVYPVLDAIHKETPITHLFHGNARGIDNMADMWGHAPRVPAVKVFRVSAEWAKYGKRAGPIRNQKMLGNGIDLVIAFPGGRGTADMVKRAKLAGVPIREVSIPQRVV